MLLLCVSNQSRCLFQAAIRTVNVWFTQLNLDNLTDSHVFEKQPPMQVCIVQITKQTFLLKTSKTPKMFFLLDYWLILLTNSPLNPFRKSFAGHRWKDKLESRRKPGVHTDNSDNRRQGVLPSFSPVETIPFALYG